MRHAVSGQRVPVRPDLVDVTPYGAPQLDVPVRLNTNETAEPVPAAFLEAVTTAVHGLSLHRYPDRAAMALRARLARRAGLAPDRVWAANGSNEILLQLFQAYGGPGRRLLLFRPGYSAHPLIARVACTDAVDADLPDDLTLTPQVARSAVEEHAPHIVCLASPNNPTGIVVGEDAIRALHDAGDGLVVVDEAYIEFAGGAGASVAALLEDLPRLVVTRTFSKAFRLAGLRLGYLLAHDWVIDDLRKVRLPYHLDAIKQVTALVALEQEHELLEHVGRVAEERERVRARLEGMPGVEVWPSAGNFLLFRTALEGQHVFDGLLARGVLIRDFSSAPRLERCLRVSIGTREEDDAFLSALAEVLQEASP